MKTFLILIFAAIILSTIINSFFKTKKNEKLSTSTVDNANTNKKANSSMQNDNASNETAGNMEHNTSIVDINIEDLAEELRDTYTIALNPCNNDYAVIYALVTCHHCIRTQRFLKSNNIPFKVVHADLFDGDARKNIMSHLKTLNERGSFPTLVMPNGEIVVGYKESKIREAIEKNDSE